VPATTTQRHLEPRQNHSTKTPANKTPPRVLKASNQTQQGRYLPSERQKWYSELDSQTEIRGENSGGLPASQQEKKVTGTSGAMRSLSVAYLKPGAVGFKATYARGQASRICLSLAHDTKESMQNPRVHAKPI